MNKWSITTRTLVLGIAPSLLMFFTLTAYFLHDKLEELQTQLSDKGNLLVRQLPPALEYGVYIKSATTLETVVTPLLQQEDLAFIEVRDNDNELLLFRKNKSNYQDGKSIGNIRLSLYNMGRAINKF